MRKSREHAYQLHNSTFSTEIGPPKNVLVENRTATNVTITCEAPDYENGTVIKYRVEYTGSEKVKVENSKQTKITLTNLKPYTEYTFTVKSRVKFKVSSLLKGSPEDWGEKSTEMSFRTRQASIPHSYIVPSVCCLCNICRAV